MDPTAIAEAIARGEQPPTMQGLFRYGGAVRTALAKMGYDLSTAQQDWNATTKYLSSINGPQQTRLRQAAQTAYDSLDIVDELTKKWDAGKFPPLNTVRLKAAINGVLGPEAQQIATQLETQIADIVSEVSNVYMAGNTPTDESMKLAAKNLSANWEKNQLLANTKLLRKNLQIRLS